MTYAEAIEHLDALTPELAPSRGSSGQSARRKFDLDHMRGLCAALGNPQDRVPSVLIAGTNGKGSTAATLASILTAAGYRTGLYTSPHLSRVNERIQLARPIEPPEYGSASIHNADGPLELKAIADEEFASLYTRVEEVAHSLVAVGELPHSPSFFERLTAVGFLYFAAQQADIMVLEVGLGGRLDATNVVEPMLSIITDIALDHQAYLGDSIAQIAREKAGILRRRGLLVTLSQHPEANQAIGEAAAALEVTAINAAEYLPPAFRNSGFAGDAGPVTPGLGRNRFSVAVRDATEVGELKIDSPLPGEHQRRNLALAIAAAVLLRNHYRYKSPQISNRNSYIIPNSAIEQGTRDTHWPGRLELLSPNLLVDVAHNPAGAWTLRAALAGVPDATPRTLLFSCLADKKLQEMASILFPLFDSGSNDPLRAYDHIVVVPVASPRAASLEDLLVAAKALGIAAHGAPSVAAGLAQVIELTPANGLVVATGSIYLVGEVRRLALNSRNAIPALADAG